MIGIITVNWNGYDVTCDLVNQVLRSSHTDFSFVVVNNSVGEAAKFDLSPVADERVRVIHSAENKGFSGGVNIGLRELLKQADISHFIIMNNDVKLDPGFIDDMLAHATRHDRIYSPLILLRDTNLVYNTGGRVVTWLGGTVNLNNHRPVDALRKTPPHFFSGCILFMHRDVAEKVGLLDEAFGTYYEDVDFCYRAREKGIEIEMIWDVRARHFHSYATKGDNVFKIYLINRNQILFARKHLDPLPRLIFISAAIVRGFFFNLKRKKFKQYIRGIREGLAFKWPDPA